MRLSFIATFVVCFSFSTFADPVDPGSLFLESFSSSCGSRGIFSQRAISETQSLKNILETIKNDGDCQGISPIFYSLIEVQDQLRFLDEGIGSERRVEIQDYISRLTYALSISTDPMEQASLANEIASQRASLIQLPLDEAEKRRLNRSKAVTNLVSYMEILNRNFAQQLNCFNSKKSLPIQLAGQLLSVSGGFFDPAVNLAVALSGRLIATFFSFFDDLKINRQLSDYRKTTMQAGLTCAMESLEQTICDIQDRRALIKAIKNYRALDQIPESWVGYELFTREYPAVRKFLRAVEAGSPAGSDPQAKSRSGFRQQESSFSQTEEETTGALGTADFELSAISESDHEARESRVRTLVTTLSQKFGGGGGGYYGQMENTSIFSDIVPSPFSESLQLWLRIGNPSPKAFDRQGNPKSLYQILAELDQKTADPDLLKRDAVSNRDVNAIKLNLQAILEKARDRLNIKRSLNLIADRHGVLTEWATPDPDGYSPGIIIEKIVQYLTKLRLTWIAHPEFFDSLEAQRDQISLLEDTLQKFSDTLQVLKRPMSDLKDERLGRALTFHEFIDKKLAEIYKIMVLREKDQVITGRITSLVQMDLEKRMRFGLLHENVPLETLVRIGTQDLIQGLSPGVTKRLEPLLADLDEAEPIARDNLYNLYKHFGESIRKSIIHLQSQAKAYRESPNGVATRKAAKLCILALNYAGLQNDTELMDVCDGKVLGADEQGHFKIDLQGRPIAVSFDKRRIVNGYPEDRLCSFRRFRNAIELQEDVLRHRH